MRELPDLSGLTAIVLAAGMSRRAAPHNKLLLPFGPDRVPVVRASVLPFCEVLFGEVVVVTGHESGAVEAALAGLPVKTVFASGFASGMGCSLAAGVQAARPTAAGFVVCPGDLPRISAHVIMTVAAEFVLAEGRWHVIPMAGGRRGHPVAIGAWLRPELQLLNQDTGARSLLERDRERCVFKEVGDVAIHQDMDWGGMS